MEDNTPVLQKKLSELRTQVGPYSNTDGVATFNFDIFSSAKIYYTIPFIVFLLFVVFRPSLIMYETDDKTKKISLTKLLAYWLVISIVLVVGVFGYNYKMTHE